MMEEKDKQQAAVEEEETSVKGRRYEQLESYHLH
jgi:hypothetical protein